MSDPLSRLGSLGAGGPAPDVDAIKLRAHRIQRRRQTGLASAGAAAMAIVAVVGVLLVTGPDGKEASTTLESAFADPTPTSGTSSALAGVAAEEDAQTSKAPAMRRVGGATTSGGSAGVSGTAPKSSEERASADTAAAAPAQAGSNPKSPLEATLTVGDAMIGRGKTFTLKVCNATSGVVNREFGSSQRYDFEVTRRGELVWRWSDGQFFTQVIGEESWKAKECKEWSDAWDGSTSDGGRAPAGDYKAVGILKSQPELRTAAKSFSLAAL
jgi:hypothetical protein